MAPFILAWLVAEGILTYRTAKATGGPPGPGQLLFSSLLFVALGIIAEAPSARKTAMMLAWGLDIAAFLNLAEFGTTKSSGIKWPPGPAPDTVIIPIGNTTPGPDPVGAHGTESSGHRSLPPTPGPGGKKK